MPCPSDSYIISQMKAIEQNEFLPPRSGQNLVIIYYLNAAYRLAVVNNLQSDVIIARLQINFAQFWWKFFFHLSEKRQKKDHLFPSGHNSCISLKVQRLNAHTFEIVVRFLYPSVPKYMKYVRQSLMAAVILVEMYAGSLHEQ